VTDPILASSIPSGTALGTTYFRKALTHQAERQWIFRELVGTGEFDAVQLQEELRAGGDTIRIRFSPTRDQAGFASTAQVTGNEAVPDFYYDQMVINSWSFAYSLTDSMAQQRVNLNLKAVPLTKLPVNWKRHWERNFVFQLTGFTPVNTAAGITNIRSAHPWLVPEGAVATDYNLSGMNIATAYDADHIFYADDAADTDAVSAGGLASHGMQLAWIDELELRARSSSYFDYPILPTSSGDYYLVLSPEGVKQLRRNTSAGDWQDITRAKIEGGQRWQDNEIFRGIIGRYGKTIIVESDYMPPGIEASDTADVEDNTRCGVFLGAKAACLAFGQGYHGGEHLDWVEQVNDYRKWGVLAESVYGVKRTIMPNLAGTDQTYGSILLVHYSEQT
jgi:hypothetical protein